MTPSKGPASKKKVPTSSASEIAPGVFVGGWNDAVGFSGTRVCVLDELPAEPIPGSTHIPIYDESTDRAIRANLERVADLAAAARSRQEPVLLFCGHGVRRGSLAGAWYLHRSEGVSLDAAYDRIRAARPQIQHLNEWVGDWKALDQEATHPHPRRRANRAT
ncbi:MAG: dual specificity protein phosphatase family protein [Thermoplasmata archaeon]|nr:dual specificity protein phosphatase family protein [Thermoplasmata archaeon]